MAWRGLFSNCQLPDRVYIFDTTLRDGEQTPGVALTPEAKIEIAKQLDVLGVDIIEAGFPVVSEGERKAVREICKLGLSSKICALARCDKRDIDEAVDSGVDWVHVFIATSDIHLKHKLRMSREEVLEKIQEHVSYAKSRGVTVHFSAEDATRTELSFLVKALKVASDSGADSLDVPDTVGFAIPSAIQRIIRSVKEVTGKQIAVHCHDDMGLAVANSLAAIEAGAEIVHATVNGIGERAGNASLEEIAVSLSVLYGIKTNIKLEEIYRTSKLVARLTGVWIPKNKAIVGENAFSHESGIHVHGVISSPETYEPIMPEIVGRKRRIILGKHSGIHGVKTKLGDYGINVDDSKAKDILSRIKSLGDMGQKVSDRDFVEIVRGAFGLEPSISKISLEEFKLTSSIDGSRSFVKLSIDGHECFGEFTHISPIYSALQATVIAASKHFKIDILDFKIDATSYQPDAICDVEIELNVDGVPSIGRAVGYDPAYTTASATVLAIQNANLR